ncbi:NAD(P)-dependent dehydrogenase (short-subunit alcohol dehydrogenase family) [Phyllobacterium ifriqiyense]|uniref:NAD(P)-dependent dehydrogenase (Short-subunit alcohol dehydrogenase family) n=1 Tax=Phyllobacterium ifriqiyense TaxID=314238 RepID=A0ABU0S999_9HYPH|nr:NAD(P)-dependent dehydrogenase (short-subunit alcohol dehydrogenase family) [Phyllobacterium ifriqiyense]
MSRLDNKVAFITGGSRGMGAAIALKLAQDGADIAITYTSAAAKADETVKAIEKLGRRALAIKADNLDVKALENAVNEAHAKLGRLDILVNNAGVYTMDTVDQLELAEFDRVMSIHVRASFVASKAAAVHMGAGGRIISIGSNLAEIVPSAGLIAYSTSKAALIGLTKSACPGSWPTGNHSQYRPPRFYRYGYESRQWRPCRSPTRPNGDPEIWRSEGYCRTGSLSRR